MEITPPTMPSLAGTTTALESKLSAYVIAIKGRYDPAGSELEKKVRELLEGIGAGNRDFVLYKNVSAFLVELTPSEAATMRLQNCVKSVDPDRPITPFMVP